MGSPLREVPSPADTEPTAPRVPRGHLVTLHVEGQEPYQVRVTNRERIAFEKTAARHSEWPARDQAPNFAMTFVCWAAAKRAGATALAFEAFADVLEDWDAEEETPADPTR